MPDIAVGANINTPGGGMAVIPSGAPVKRNPIYLITLEKTVGKTQVIEKFISLDNPQSENGFIRVKGIFCERAEEEIIKSFNDILTNSPKELILEMLFPHHRIVSIRSLVFSAVKGTTQIKSDR
jgi:hypothetical protein